MITAWHARFSNGKYVEATPLQIVNHFMGGGDYYTHFLVVYSDKSDAVTDGIKEMRAVKKYIDEEPLRIKQEEKRKEEEAIKNNKDGL